MMHDVYRDLADGYSCHRCSLWARVRAMFDLLPCPPPNGK